MHGRIHCIVVPAILLHGDTFFKLFVHGRRLSVETTLLFLYFLRYMYYFRFGAVIFSCCAVVCGHCLRARFSVRISMLSDTVLEILEFPVWLSDIYFRLLIGVEFLLCTLSLPKFLLLLL